MKRLRRETVCNGRLYRFSPIFHSFGSDFRIFGFRIDGDLLPKLDSVPRSNALICLSQSREGRQALQDRYSWLQEVN